MNKSTQNKIYLTATLALFSLAISAQDLITRKLPGTVKVSNEIASKESQIPTGKDLVNQTIQAASKEALVSCSDKINYVGNTQGGSFQVGGKNGFTGVYQVFPSYKGSIIGVEFDAAKMNGTNPTLVIAVLNSNSAGYPGSTIAGSVAVTITNTSMQTYTVMFPSPVIPAASAVGFGMGFYNFANLTDSAEFFNGPQLSSSSNLYSYVTIPTSGSYSSVNQFFPGTYIDFLFRPIVSTSVNPNWVSAKTHTGCGAPAIFNFTNTTAPTSTYVGNAVINPSGITESINYGDLTPTVNYTNTVETHTYTSIGNYTANFTQTYVGWTSNCVESKTIAIVVDNPAPAFTHIVNGLTVNLNNTSNINFGLTNYVWNFGDLSTSTQQQPGSHTYASPGTYVIELEAMAPCGKVKFSVSVTVTGPTGLGENTWSNSISLFPNPASSTLKISNSGVNVTESTVLVYNTIGTLVKSFHNPEFNSGTATIDISELAEGMYFVKMKNEKGEVVKSFTKIK